jgi:hypothetical protein
MANIKAHFFGGGIAVNNDFVMTVNDTNGSFFIDTIDTNTYLYDVTTSDGYSATGLTSRHTITFPTGLGVKTVTISGQFPRIYFANNPNSKDKLLSVDNWGSYGLQNGTFEGSQGGGFFGCSNLTIIAEDVDNLNLIILANNFFRGCNLSTLPDGLTLPLLSNGTNMFFNNTINTTRYSQLLIDLESGNANNNVEFDGGNSKYNAAGQTARNILTGGTRSWTITDGGLE